MDPMKEWALHKREKRTHRLIVLGVFAALIGAGAVWYALHRTPMHASCTTSEDCGDDGYCLFAADNTSEGQCTRTCSTASDCPDDMECGLGRQMDENGKTSIFGAKRVCMWK